MASLTTFPLIDDRFAGRTQLGCQLSLTDAEPESQAHEGSPVILGYGHAAHGHGAASGTAVAAPIPPSHELRSGFSRCCRGEPSDEQSSPERRGEAPSRAAARSVRT